jgi:Superinfection immunity protein
MFMTLFDNVVGLWPLLLPIALIPYFLPAILAERYKHPYQQGIFVINLFLGWSLLGWVGALAWAVCPPRRVSSCD